jgi:hypothetical protein
MKEPLLSFLIATIVAACATVDEQPTDDASLEKRIQHTWSSREVTDHTIIDGQTAYLPGGVMNLFGHVNHNGTFIKVIGSGTWHIKNGYLFSTITTSNIPYIIPNGFTSADKIVRVTEKELTTVSSIDGSTETAHRIR